jgi:hypothetical protein
MKLNRKTTSATTKQQMDQTAGDVEHPPAKEPRDEENHG